MAVKGKIFELGNAEDGDMEVTEKVSKRAVQKIRSSIRKAVSDMEIEIDKDISSAVDKYMAAWLRKMVSQQAYMHLTPCGSKIRVYVSLPASNIGTESDPSWMVDLVEIIDELHEGERGGTIPLTAKERKNTIKTRDAFQRIVDLYNQDLETR